MEEASVMMVGLNPERIMQGLLQITDQKRGAERNFRLVADYSMPNDYSEQSTPVFRGKVHHLLRSDKAS